MFSAFCWRRIGDIFQRFIVHSPTPCLYISGDNMLHMHRFVMQRETVGEECAAQCNGLLDACEAFFCANAKTLVMDEDFLHLVRVFKTSLPRLWCTRETHLTCLAALF